MQRCEHQELELQKSTKKAQEAIALAAEESAKTKAAKEVIKSLTAQVRINEGAALFLIEVNVGYLELCNLWMLVKFAYISLQF